MLQTVPSAVELVKTFSVLEQVIAEHNKFLASLPKRPDYGKTDSTGLHHDSKQYYQYISLDPHNFLKALVPHLAKGKSFLDVGCGMGDKLRLVSQIAPSLRIGGIEFHKPYAEMARLHTPTATVIHCDALYYDDYRSWDVLYAYVPIMDRTLMGQLTERIVRQMRRGATYVQFGSGVQPKYVQRRLKRDDDVGCYVYRKP